MMRRILSVATALGLLAASCGMVSVAEADTAGAATSTTPIVVGGDGDVAVSPGLAQGFEAGIYRFNKAGGLSGRKIKFVGFLDDGFSPTTNETNAQQLVQNDHVLAVAPFFSEVAGGSTATFLANAKVPFIGWSTDGAFEAEPKWGFGVNGNQGNPSVQGLAGMNQLLKATGNTKTPSKVKLAFIGVDVPGGSISNASLAGVAKYAGMKVVYQEATVPALGNTSYAPYAQAIISSGANAVYEVLASPQAIGLAAALKTAQWKGTIVNGVTYYPGELASQPNEASALNGVYVEDEFPAGENDTPAVTQEEKDLESVGQPPYLSAGVSIGYWSAIILESMLKATLKAEGNDPNKVTSVTLQQTVTGPQGYAYIDPIAGGIGNEYFPAAETIPTGCGTLVKTVGTNFKQITPFQCDGAVNVKYGKIVNQKTGKLES
jgi:ABC-type branched-subunit amino acid transport system substrate-binding protein